jgi:hypothetical protein
MSSVLKLDLRSADDDRELEFELQYQRSLTTEQRFQMMFLRSRAIAEQLERLGHRKPAEILKRP